MNRRCFPRSPLAQNGPHAAIALLTACMLFVTSCQRGTMEPGAAEELTVLTYNIHHGEGTDGVFDLERLADVIRESEAQLVALQEVDVRTGRASGVDQAAELGRLTNMEVVFKEAIEYDGGLYGEAILSSLPIVDVSFQPLSAAPGLEQRVALQVIAQTPRGARVRFIGTHLDHTRDPAARLQQCREILAWTEVGQAKLLPTILLGDLNAQPGSDELQLLQSRFESAADPTPLTFPASNPVKAIDWILLGPTGHWQVLDVDTLDETVASDHLPLRARLALPHSP